MHSNIPQMSPKTCRFHFNTSLMSPKVHEMRSKAFLKIQKSGAMRSNVFQMRSKAHNVTFRQSLYRLPDSKYGILNYILICIDV